MGRNPVIVIKRRNCQMKRKNTATVIFAALVSVCMMLTTLGGCTGEVAPDVSSESSEVESVTGRQDGERFEAVIQLEGMDETVHYEHVRNETAGFEIDYDYEQLERRGEPDHEQFVSRFDNPEKPDNYIEVTLKSENVDAVSAAIKGELAEQYKNVSMDEQYTLESAGSCVQISASQARKNKAPKDSLQTVYIIPAAKGSLVVKVHCTIESAEGFGARFTNIVNTLTVIGK